MWQRRDLVVDLAVSGAVLGWTLLMIAGGGLGTADPRSRGLDPLGVALACASALPLIARRAIPGAAYAVTALATVALLALRYPIDVPLGPAVCAYAFAVAYSAHPDLARRRLALLAVVTFIPFITVSYSLAGVRVWDITPELLGWLGIFVGIWLAGDRTRLRREQMSQLRELAHRAQHEAERERRLAAAEERTRIARELHDSAGHAINVILVQAGAARLLHERNPEGSRAAIGTIEEVARATIGEIDRLVRALREDGATEPPPAYPGALDELIARHRATGLTLDTQVETPYPPLPRSVAWAAYRILQEALTNAARHGCGHAEVAVRSRRDAVEITVTNPTPPRVASARPSTSGHGIVGMRERATLLGGTLETTKDGGTFQLRARLPYSEATA